MEVMRRNQSFLGQFPDKYCDVKLSTQDGAEHAPIEAHRVVLAAVSAKLEKLFDDAGEGVGPVVVRNIKYEVLKKIVQYIYFGRVQIGDSDAEIEDFQDGLDMLRVKVKEQVGLSESEALPLGNISDPLSEFGNVNPRPDLSNISSQGNLVDVQNNLTDSNISSVSVAVQHNSQAVSVGVQHDKEGVSVGVQHYPEAVSLGVQHSPEVFSVGVQHFSKAVTVGVQHYPEVVSVGVQHYPEAVSVGVEHYPEAISVGVQHSPEAVSVNVQHGQEAVSPGVQQGHKAYSAGAQHDHVAVSPGVQHDKVAASAGAQHDHVAVSPGVQHDKVAASAGAQHDQVAVSAGVHNNSIPANNEESMTSYSSNQSQSDISAFFGSESENVKSSKTKVSNSSYAKSKAEVKKDEPGFKCPICKVHKKYKSFRSLLDHCRRYHSKVVKSSKKFVCEICHQVVPEYCFELHHQFYHRSDLEKRIDSLEAGIAGSRRFIKKAVSRRPDKEYMKDLQEKMMNNKKTPKARLMLQKLSICFKCGATFSDQTELSSHFKVVHGLNSEFKKKIFKLIR